MPFNIISMIMLVIPPAITSESSWTSPNIRIATEWSLNVLDLIDPEYGYIGTVYGVESEEGFEWHTVLIDKDCILHFEGNSLIGSIPYSGDVYLMNFSPDCQYLLVYCFYMDDRYHRVDEKLILFDFEENTAKSIPLFSSEIGLHGNPRIRVTNGGSVLVKHSTYLRMYDSDFNCILSRDDFIWGGEFVGLSNTGDRFYSTTNNSLYAYDMQGNLLWNTELPEPHEFGTREFEMSGTRSIIAVKDWYNLCLISTDDGSQIERFNFDEKIYDVEFSESDSIVAAVFTTHPQTTPLRPIHSFGVITISLQNRSYELSSIFQADNHRSVPGMPNSFSTYTVSDNGALLGFLYYTPSFGRVALLSPDMEILWLSENVKQNGSWSFHLMSNRGLRSDGSGFWYFDGESIHSCLIEGM